MESPEAISVKVDKLLDEIKALKIQREESSSDAKKSTFIQCEIHRKFAILDWAKSVTSQLDGESCTELDKTWALVATEREDSKATRDDLEAMLILSRNKERGNEQQAKEDHEQKIELGEKDPFPFLDLPELVVRQKVLSYLTSPQDKLNVWEVIPSVGCLMGWNRTTLLFESVVPIVKQQTGEDYYPLLNWKDLYNLSRVTPFLQDYIKKDYEAKQWSQGLSLGNILEQVSSGVDDPKWARSSIFPTQVGLRLENEDAEESKRLMTCLDQVGARIFNLSLRLKLSKTPFQTLEKLAGILSRTPNLNRLSLSLIGVEDGENANRENEEWEWRNAESIELPHLASLKKLDLYGHSQFELVKSALLEMCGNGLRDLSIDWKGEQSSKPLLLDRFDKIHCPHLTNLFFKWRECKDVSFDLNLLVDSPLTSIGLEINENIIGKDFVGVLILLGRLFGDTLEQINFRTNFGWRNDNDGQQDQPSVPPAVTWMLDLKFPKLKHLMFEKFSSPISWNFLLLFPSLEQLGFANLERARDVKFGEDENIVGMSFTSTEVIKATIWKVLPKLEKCSVWYKTPNEPGSRPAFTLTRRDCLRFQRKDDPNNGSNSSDESSTTELSDSEMD